MNDEAYEEFFEIGYKVRELSASASPTESILIDTIIYLLDKIESLDSRLDRVEREDNEIK